MDIVIVGFSCELVLHVMRLRAARRMRARYHNGNYSIRHSRRSQQPSQNKTRQLLMSCSGDSDGVSPTMRERELIREAEPKRQREKNAIRQIVELKEIYFDKLAIITHRDFQ